MPSGVCIADRVTLDTGDTLDGIVREEGDTIILQYIARQTGVYRMKGVTIPRKRIKKIESDPTYFQKYKGIMHALPGAMEPAPAVSAVRNGSLEEAIRKGNAELAGNLQGERERMKHAKFYWGWHEGFHWDPNNGWHRWNHEGLYDPYDPNITARDKRE